MTLRQPRAAAAAAPGTTTSPRERPMSTDTATADDDALRWPLAAAADLQDHLLAACNDLDRLQALLAHACDVLLLSFHGAHDQQQALDDLAGHLGRAITAMQFQDMASQLVGHTRRRLQSCADRLARDTLDADEDGEAVVSAPPLRPNPVTQDEMDAGSIELF